MHPQTSERTVAMHELRFERCSEAVMLTDVLLQFVVGDEFASRLQTQCTPEKKVSGCVLQY